MTQLIEFLKNMRKRGYIGMTHEAKFAFIGIGNHSIHNLYPLINYFRANLKYIVTRSEKNAQLIDQGFPNSEGTNDLAKVLNDSEINGVFICANPSAHFKLVKQSLEAGKNVFVEKPPCTTLEELKALIELEKKSNVSCFVGFQKQYAPVNIELKKHIKSKASYSYKFLTGSYPEGDAFLDLYIHSLALMPFLFGPAKLQNAIEYKSKTGNTVFLHIKHDNGTIGSMELSTDYSWAGASETLSVNTDKGTFASLNTEELSFKPKQGAILGIPKEKIFGGKMTDITLIRRNNFTPVLENNQLYSNGYYSEIEAFIKHCDGKKVSNSSSFCSCLNTYELIAEIKNKLDVR